MKKSSFTFKVTSLLALAWIVFSFLLPSCDKKDDDNVSNDPPSPNELPGTWNEVAAMPVYITETSVTVMNDRIYVAGGVIFNDTSDVVWEYDPVADEWSEFATLPVKLHHAASATLGGKLYVIGGYRGEQGFGGHASKRVFAVDPGTRSVSEVASIPQPVAAGTASACNGKIYLFGGLEVFNSGEYNEYVYCYDAQQDDWTIATIFANAREHFTSISVDSAIYILGGRKFDPGQFAFDTYNSFEAFIPQDNDWVTLPDMPRETSSAAAGVISGGIYYFSGEYGTDPAGFQMLNKGFKYDPESGEWSEVKGPPVSRHGTCGASINGKIYIPGGGIESFHYASTNLTHVFTPEEIN